MVQKILFYPSARLFLTSNFISSSSTYTVVSLRKPPFIFSCLRVTGLSGQADANLYPVWRRLRPSPCCSKVFLSACVSNPAVAWPLENPLVMEHFPSIGITSSSKLECHYLALMTAVPHGESKRNLHIHRALAGPSFWHSIHSPPCHIWKISVSFELAAVVMMAELVAMFVNSQREYT